MIGEQSVGKLNGFNKDGKLGQLIRFVIVGGLSAGIHYIIYIGLGLIQIQHNIAYTIAYALSFIFNFIASNYFTFATKPNTVGGIRFAGAHMCNYLLQMTLLNGFIYLGIGKYLAPLFVFTISVPVNFVLVRIALKVGKKD